MINEDEDADEGVDKDENIDEDEGVDKDENIDEDKDIEKNENADKDEEKSDNFGLYLVSLPDYTQFIIEHLKKKQLVLKDSSIRLLFDKKRKIILKKQAFEKEFPNFKFKDLQNLSLIMIPVMFSLQKHALNSDLDILTLSDLENEISTILKIQTSKIKLIRKKLSEQDFKIGQKKSFIEILKNNFSKELIEHISSSLEIIGDIGIVEIDRFDNLINHISEIKRAGFQTVSDFKEYIADLILQQNKNLTAIYNKAGAVEGEYRVRPLQILKGVPHTITRYKENGCIFELDVSQVFFTPRLVFERNRIANLSIEDNCKILDCFAGIGPFSIQIGSKVTSHILGCELNPVAYKFFLRNISLNKKKLKSDIVIFNGDIRNLKDWNKAKPFLNSTDYIIMNLPEKSIDLISSTKYFIKPTGTKYFIYTFLPNENAINQGIKGIENKAKSCNLKLVKVEHHRIIKNYSPKTVYAVFEVIIMRN